MKINLEKTSKHIPDRKTSTRPREKKTKKKTLPKVDRSWQVMLDKELKTKVAAKAGELGITRSQLIEQAIRKMLDKK